jgi:predicted RNA-binding Zn-ribbon protein involved in translation (DUF1610 family)
VWARHHVCASKTNAKDAGCGVAASERNGTVAFAVPRCREKMVNVDATTRSVLVAYAGADSLSTSPVLHDAMLIIYTLPPRRVV